MTDVMCINLSELKFDQVISFPALLGTNAESDARFKLNHVIGGDYYVLDATVRVDDVVIEAIVKSKDTTCGAVIRKLQAMARFHRTSKVKVEIKETYNLTEQS